jgi:hypothetical protein
MFQIIQSRIMPVALLLLACPSGTGQWAKADPAETKNPYFAITVIDDQTGRGVPLVELRTVNGLRYYTDSAGVVAFHEPGLMGQRVFFHVSSHGYEFPKDGFGFRGRALDVTASGSAHLPIKRINIAQRLYRMTGEGIYRDSVLIGQKPPIERPLLNGQVLGSDSVLNVVYRGKIFWFWGDTNRPSYPLGNFHMPGATSLLPDRGGLDPDTGVNLDYFVDENGFAKETARMPGDGPTWLSGLVNVPGDDGQERLFATYVKVRNFLEVYQRGLVEFDADSQTFKKISQFDLDEPLYPDGHPFFHVADGVQYVYFANPYPVTRVPATAAAVTDLSQYEAYTCLQPGGTPQSPKFARGPDGKIVWGWKRATPALGGPDIAKLVRSGNVTAEESIFQLRDVQTDRPVIAHRGSVYFNQYRGRWVMIATEQEGTSFLGEVWYAEADTPLGPWVYARKIVTHEKYSFYNPKQHPMFDQQDGRVIFFEGTYTDFFAGAAFPTPRYDYNQIMYKLELDAPRLVLPVAVYQAAENGQYFTKPISEKARPEPAQIAFFAPDRPAEGLTPIVQIAGILRRAVAGDGDEEATTLFYALPPHTTDAPAAIPLYAFMHAGDQPPVYTTDASIDVPGYMRSEQPVCLVWRNPLEHGILPAAHDR